MKKRILGCIIAVLIAVSLFASTVSAASDTFAPYNSYEYNKFGEAVSVPIGYSLKRTIDKSYLGLADDFDSPTDLCYHNGHLFILDGGNSRIIEVDENYKYVKEYSNFTISEKLASEKSVTLNNEGYVGFDNAAGFTVTEDYIFIADTTGNRILRSDFNCNIDMVVLRPDEVLNSTEALFAPRKIEIDELGRIYVTSGNIALGIMIFSADGEFIEFYGANEVVSTTQSIVRFFRKLFLNTLQLEMVEQSTPVTIINMDFAKNGFMYTVSPYRNASSTTAEPEMVRKLNFNGDNLISDELIFGDVIKSEKGNRNLFADIDVDANGFINILDETNGRVFQYTDTGMLVTVFGSKSDQAGCFSAASAIESIDEDIIVADSDKNCVFVYKASNYVKNVHSAVLKLNNNDFEGSANEWNNLLKSNSNSYLCYQGLGRIADYQGDYKEAMEYYKLAYDQDGYALAFQENRQILIEKYSVLIVLIVALIVILFVFSSKFLKRLTLPIPGKAYSQIESKYGMEFYVLLHPIDGFSQFKTRKIPSLKVSGIIVFSWLIITILDFNCTGFAFSINRSVDFNMLVTLVVTLGVYLLFCIANWAICTLFEGKGTIKDIFATTAYSLIPYVVSRLIMTILTNFLVPSESVFIGIVSVIGILWTAMVLILGMLTIHDFSLGKTIFTLILTVLGMVAMIFLIILLYSLMKQMFGFFTSVYKEIEFRL